MSEVSAQALTGATVLVTGGAGFLGVLSPGRCSPECGEIRILSSDEAKQDQMRHDLADERLRFHLRVVPTPPASSRLWPG